MRQIATGRIDVFPHFCNPSITSADKKIVIRPPMFDRLQQKWKVSAVQVILILCTFAIGGSLTGFAGKQIMNLVPVDNRFLWVVIYIIVVTLIWPLAVLLISIPFGQFGFFTRYLRKMGQRLRLVSVPNTDATPVNTSSLPASTGTTPRFLAKPATPSQIAIFASGAGSNAQKIIEHFSGSPITKVALLVSNKAHAGALDIAARENIPTLVITKEKFFNGDAYLPELKAAGIDFIVLAGFLWKVPDALIAAYPGRIINIHPALLPKFGGKGMYGHHVHAAVIAAGEKESGITIHYVDGHYDNGDIIFQAKCTVHADDTPGTLAQRIHMLEHEHYPKVIEQLLSSTSR